MSLHLVYKILDLKLLGWFVPEQPTIEFVQKASAG